jgi:hypothetical protein
LPIQSPTLQIIFRNKDKITTTHEAAHENMMRNGAMQEHRH